MESKKWECCADETRCASAFGINEGNCSKAEGR